jgi:hypothetical protein
VCDGMLTERDWHLDEAHRTARRWDDSEFRAINTRLKIDTHSHTHTVLCNVVCGGGEGGDTEAGVVLAIVS